MGLGHFYTKQQSKEIAPGRPPVNDASMVSSWFSLDSQDL